MSAAFTVPMSADLIDALNVAEPTSAINQLWRMYNQRRVVKAYPNDTTNTGGVVPIVTPYQKYTYTGTSSLTFAMSVEHKAAIADATLTEGADVQRLIFWNGLLQSIYDMASGFVILSEGAGGIDGMDYSSRSGPTRYSEPALMFTDAGITGIERRQGEDIDTITGYGSFYEQGDIIGPWCFRDVAALLSLLKYRYFLPTVARGYTNTGGAFGLFGRNATLQDVIDNICTPGNGNGQGWNSTPETLDATNASSLAYVNVNSWIKPNGGGGSPWYYEGATGKRILSPGYIAPRSDLPTMTLDFYGVAGLPELDFTSNQASDFGDDVFRATDPDAEAVINCASLLATDRDPIAPSASADYIDLGFAFDNDIIPIRDLHAFDDNGNEQARGFALTRGFFVAGVTGYELEGVA